MVDIDFRGVADYFTQRQEAQRLFDDPVRWAQAHGLFLWSKQREVMESVVKHPKTLVVTGNGVGKTRLAATAVCWWVGTRPVNASTVVTTATNWKQVRNILWKEIPRIKATAKLPGRITADAQWKIGDRQDPVAFGLKPDDKDESGFQGVHDQYVLVIIDEAGGVSKEIFTAADAITTNEHARILAIANPNDVSGHMASLYQEQIKLPPEERTWNIIQFGAYDSPNFTGEEVPPEVASALVQKTWVEARKKEWGEGDARYIARVLGQFPSKTDAGLFNLGAVMSSMARHSAEESSEGPCVLGVDVARYGSDLSVITLRRGRRVEIVRRLSGASGPELAHIIGQIASVEGAYEVRVDGVGVGVSVIDHLPAHLPENCKILSVVGNAASPDHTRWHNYRAAMYDQVSRLIARGELDIPEDDVLYKEISSIDYTYRGSALLIMSKEEMRKKGLASPDTLDAVVYAALDVTLLESGIVDDLPEPDPDIMDEYDIFDPWLLDLTEPWSFLP